MVNFPKVLRVITTSFADFIAIVNTAKCLEFKKQVKCFSILITNQ